MIRNIIFICTGSKGGAKKYIEQHIAYNNKKNIFLISEQPKKNYNINNNNNISLFDENVLENISKGKLTILRLAKNLDLKKTVIFITNYAILVNFFFLFLSLQKQGLKVVITLHSGLLNISIKNFIAALIFSFCIFCSDKIIYGSESSREWWFKFFPWIKLKKNKIIHNGIRLRTFKKINKVKNISFVGRLEYENDPEFFCKLVKSINLSKKNNYKFHIFGDGSLKKKLLLYYKNLIKFHGWTEEKKIYKISDIVIITSFVNNFPYVALESFSYGIPVITFSKGDINKIVVNQKNGFIIKERNEKIFNNILKITVQKYNYLSKNSYLTAKKFDEKKSCNNIWNYILK
jgi:glycosyltransferase involved in cell wall biosynthesis